MVQSLRIGAGGRWPVFDETPSSKVVKQQSNVSCGAACGEMLFKDRGLNITQDVIKEASYAPIEVQDLAVVLNQLDPSRTRQWLAGGLIIPHLSDEKLIEELNKTGSWGAVMWELGASIGHIVIIDGLNNDGRLTIRDPWDGTTYTMQMNDFLRVWSRLGLYATQVRRR